MVLEDDAGFDRDYVNLLAERMAELDGVPEWDLLYIYKKQKHTEIKEKAVDGTKNWVYAEFNTGTINYIVSETGEACAWIATIGHPLQKLFYTIKYSNLI